MMIRLPTVLKSANLILVEPSGPAQAFTGIALPFSLCTKYTCLVGICQRSERMGPVSVVCIATGYGLEGPGIESRWGRNFPHLSSPSLGPTQPPIQWVLGLSRW